ncbi:peptidoglycan-binding protein [Actinomadura harenae]|uniref:Peptidoglycan-binding protein n=1 Tax=Actinomadura harenae TaxID=2483351 RepID=A0A3M2LXK3_9ACTN|nr:peptidoglycan-binding protein [Actinomadura harenae]RMI41876.1 peptidoglycan-binding protein [Actinomadura harenae]
MKLPKYAAAATAAVAFVSIAGVTAVSAAQADSGHKAVPSADAAALPSVNMEALVKAAQIDPRRADNKLTPGAKASVLLVEKALADKHLLDKKWVDGYFGTTTTAAYTKYQKSLGYKGLSANGLPGKSSLAKLGAGRFTVNHVIVPGAKVKFGPKYVVDTRTQKMLLQAQKVLHRKLVLDQGSYNPGGDPTSVGTHDGGGVVDINVKGMSAATRTSVAKALRQVGFAAWVRNPSQGDWPWHIHATAINDTDLSVQAQHQIGDYYLGKNGLANRGKDDGPKVTIRTWEEYLRLH